MTQAAPLKIGLLMHPLNTTDWRRYQSGNFGSGPEIPDHVIWDELRDLALLAEPLGFDSLWITEHHVTPYGLNPDPLQILSYFAGQTERIGLGTAVVVLPWHDPVRVAEQIALLDNLAPNRRIKIGFGRGVAESEYAHLRVDQNTARERFDEGVEIIRAALTQQTFSYDGQMFQVPSTHLRPNLRNPAVVGDFFGAFASAGSLRATADLGLGMAFTNGRSPVDIRADVIEFNQIRARKALAPVQPLVAQWLYCAETEEAAYEGAKRYMGENGREVQYHYRQQEWTSKIGKIKGYEEYGAMRRLDEVLEMDRDEQDRRTMAPQIWGTPQMCIDKVLALRETTAADEIIFLCKFGGMSYDVAARSVRLFGEEVLPALHATPATFPDWARPGADSPVEHAHSSLAG